MVYNNLCQVCNREREAGVDISSKIIRYKIDPSGNSTTDVIEVCVHDGDCSVLDLGVCECGMRGFLMAPEDQNGILTERNSILQQLHIDFQSKTKGVFCKSCYDPLPCEECGTLSHKLKKLNLSDGVEVNYCENCASEYRTCSVCREVHTKYHSQLEGYICGNCASSVVRCNCCGSLERPMNIFDWSDGTTACPNCTSTTTCAYCGVETICKYTEDMYICKNHWDLCKDLPKVSGYGHTRAITFNKTQLDGSGTKRPLLYFGIENEFQVNISRVKFPVATIPIRRRLLTKSIQSFFPTAACKRDSSLNMSYSRRVYDVGVEVAWQPMTFNYIKSQTDNFKHMFKEIGKGLHKTMPQAGMHIHVSKDAFTPFHFLKFTNFFYMTEKYPFLVAIAGRSPNQYARVRAAASMAGDKHGNQQTGKRLAYSDISIGGLARNRTKDLKTKQRNTFYADRYDIINITNSATYEIRIFKGARTFSEFMSRIEFVHSIYMYTKDVSHKAMSIDGYFTFVERNAKTYPELLAVVTKFKGGI